MRKLVFVLLACGCTDHRDSVVDGTQSLRITLKSPSDPGSPDNRLTDKNIVFDIEALDETGAVDTGFKADLQVYAQFLGTLTPSFGSQPLATFTISDGGVLLNQMLTLPGVFGPTVVWIDNGSGLGSEYVHGTVTGTSPTIWFDDPVIADLQTPRDEMGLDALTGEPLQDKQIAVGGAPGSGSAKLRSRYGDMEGKLIVTAVFAQGYCVSDVKCPGGNPPCTARPANAASPTGFDEYNHALIFSFSAPRAQNGQLIQVGSEITGFAGGLTEFQGLTEVGFPQSFAAVDANGDLTAPNTALLPPPVVVDPATWFKSLSDPQGEINFERNEAGLIEVDQATVCDLDDDFDKFKQWKLDPSGTGGDCSSRNDVVSVVTSGITGIDPAALVGMKLPKVIGSLRPLNFPSGGSVWLMFPRGAEDLTLQ